MTTSEDLYFAAVEQMANSDGTLSMAGTVVVADSDRVGTRTATSYPLRGCTVVWCDPDLLERLGEFERPDAMSTPEFVDRAASLGAELVGIGHQRVLDEPLRRPDADDHGVTFRVLDRESRHDRALLAGLGDTCGPDDVDEADLDLDRLDPNISGLVDAEGVVIAYASARPSEIDVGFDDIAVLTAPSVRGRRLGALAVHEFIRHRLETDPGCRFLYRCNRDNVASNRLAESLGFSLVQVIGAMRFPDG